MLLILQCFLLLLLSIPVWAAVDVQTFDTESQRQRYLALVEELRCPKCQNQSLSGSDAEIAADLRRQLHQLLLEGKTDREIVTFMVDRYGDFILYRPRLQVNTGLLWFTPILLLLLGAIILWKMTYRHVDSELLTQGEKDQLKGLLAGSSRTHNHDNEQSTAEESTAEESTAEKTDDKIERSGLNT